MIPVLLKGSLFGIYDAGGAKTVKSARIFPPSKGMQGDVNCECIVLYLIPKLQFGNEFK
jgi:hypothetical protein